ncbi:hypothetical protein PAHAL_2G023600 [Panicum hallii]|jgi:hypothetical protein|uniref:Uncharacterized protein n=1 Tax=Panicum hallii TaxID=206008 RepID=A0A2T8KMT2_9POAL|nr:hypothetical protein PAHAL_2G023600 [Panicum hallii]
MQMQCIISRLFIRWIDLLTNFLRMRERERAYSHRAREVARWQSNPNVVQVCSVAQNKDARWPSAGLLTFPPSWPYGGNKTCSSADNAHATMTKRTKNFGCIGLNLLRSLLEEEAGRRNLLPVILSSFLCFSFDVQ